MNRLEVGTEPRSASIARSDVRRCLGPPSPLWAPSLGGVLEAIAVSLRTAPLHDGSTRVRVRDAFAGCVVTGTRMQGRERDGTQGEKAGIVPDHVRRLGDATR
jgi:hypothetical protein